MIRAFLIDDQPSKSGSWIGSSTFCRTPGNHLIAPSSLESASRSSGKNAVWFPVVYDGSAVERESESLFLMHESDLASDLRYTVRNVVPDDTKSRLVGDDDRLLGRRTYGREESPETMLAFEPKDRHETESSEVAIDELAQIPRGYLFFWHTASFPVGLLDVLLEFYRIRLRPSMFGLDFLRIEEYNSTCE